MKKFAIALVCMLFVWTAGVTAQEAEETDSVESSAPAAPVNAGASAAAEAAAAANAAGSAEASAREAAKSLEEARALLKEAADAAEAARTAQRAAESALAASGEAAGTSVPAGASGGTGEAGPKLFTVIMDAVFDVAYGRYFTGNYSTKTAALTTSENPYKYQGDGMLKAFHLSAFDEPLNLRLKFAYAGDWAGASLELKAEAEGRILGDWELWLRLAKEGRAFWFPGLKILAGNTGQRGFVNDARYQHFDDFLRTKVDNLGVIVPDWQMTSSYKLSDYLQDANFPWGYGYADLNKGYAVYTGSDTADLFMVAGGEVRQTAGLLFDLDWPWVSLGLSAGALFEDITEPFPSPWKVAVGTSLYDSANDPVINSKINFGVRVEALEVAGLLNIQGVYKFSDSFLAKIEAPDAKHIIEELVSCHAFGLYANMQVFDFLGVTAGYSGQFQTWDNPFYEDTQIDNQISGSVARAEAHFLSLYKTANLPFYSGIDLRAYFTMIPRLTVTFNNNLSFASVQGTDKAQTFQNFSRGWAYTAELNTADSADRTESYLGLYNALGASYEVTPVLTADVQVANMFGLFTLTGKKNDKQAGNNILGAYAGVTLKVLDIAGIKASLRGGFDVKLHSYYYQDAATDDLHEGGYIEFGIPLGIRVEY